MQIVAISPAEVESIVPAIPLPVHSDMVLIHLILGVPEVLIHGLVGYRRYYAFLIPQPKSKVETRYWAIRLLKHSTYQWQQVYLGCDPISDAPPRPARYRKGEWRLVIDEFSFLQCIGSESICWVKKDLILEMAHRGTGLLTMQ